MKLFSQTFLDELCSRAGASPRLRAHHNVHTSNADLVQRFFVAASRGTYFRPHRHSTRAELAFVIRGQFDVLTFDGAGVVTARYRVGPGTGNLGFETPQGTWHTLLVTTEDALFLEVKEGPYDPATLSEFAPWAPAEGHESVPAFQRWLEQAQPGSVPPQGHL
jgi:cupin fold WbuC family metalloprotein